MIRLVGLRSTNTLKVFTRDGSLWKSFIGVTDSSPIGHYVVDPLMAGGAFTIKDFSAQELGKLVHEKDAKVNGMTATIGGIEAPLVRLAPRSYGHVQISDDAWCALTEWLTPLFPGNVVVYTALEVAKS